MPIRRVTIKNIARLKERFNPLKIGSDEFTTISLRKLIIAPQRLPMIRIIANKNFIENHSQTSDTGGVIRFSVIKYHTNYIINHWD